MKISKLVLLYIIMLSGFSKPVSAFDDPKIRGLEVKTVKDLNATQKPAYFSFETGQVVDDSESLSLKWDIAFNKTAILLNGGTGGNGKVSAMLIRNTSFEKLTEAPAEGFKTDANEAKVIPTGSGNGWYTYDMDSHVISPIEGTILLFKTNQGKYVKLQILSYYKTGTEDTGFYTFKYVVQADGSRNLK